MPGEELIQRGYIVNGEIRGDLFGTFECLNIGQTTTRELVRVGLVQSIPAEIKFPFQEYQATKRTGAAKPDAVFFRRRNGGLEVVASKEMKKPTEFNTKKKRLKAQEQALFSASVLGAYVAIASDGTDYLYINVQKSLEQLTIALIEETRELNPAVLEELLSEETGVPKNPGPLAERVWQAIWHATKKEPKSCLMTFVEIFILKFLSDNLKERDLPRKYSFYELVNYDDKNFLENYGKTQIEYYVQDIRTYIKRIFPEKTVVDNHEILSLFGLETIVSPSSVINKFAFLQSSSTTSLATFNRTFVEILGYFQEFGPLHHIDPEFKLRLYETFLKKTVGQQKLGQFFTPRNIVRAMIKMACLSQLPDNSIVFDPAAGVGGFVLEPLIEPNALQGNITFRGGIATSRVRLIGADLEEDTNILAKSNTLIHLAELLRDPSVSLEGLNKLMAETFLVLNTNQHLGTLEHPMREKVDVILTNPPYVTKGSRIYKEEISNIQGLKNGLDLREYYDRCGLGLESLFVRYISGALKPGGRAFVVVPQGLLTRTETSMKEKLLSECNFLGSIALPRNTFYSTPQKTYIIILKKRRTANEPRPDVFCAISTSVGESLDARRVPTPDNNDLDLIADAFLAYSEGRRIPEVIANKIRIVSADRFSDSDRWDVYRFWTDDELVELGEREEAISRTSFLEEIRNRFSEISEDITTVERELLELTASEMASITIADNALFTVRRGKRVIRKDGDQHPGEILVYSGSKDPARPLCRVSEEWARSMNIPIEDRPIITVNANGYVGAVHLRNERCIIHDDVMIIETLKQNLDMEYLVHALRSAIAEGNYEYEAKLYNRVKELSVDVPVLPSGDFDLDRQKEISKAYKRFVTLKQGIAELGNWSAGARIKN